jgi:hypothetical protein
MKERRKPPKYVVLCKIELKYNGPNIMIGQHFCSLYVYTARNRICNYIEIWALIIRVEMRMSRTSINQLLLNIPHLSPDNRGSMPSETLATQPSWSQCNIKNESL